MEEDLTGITLHGETRVGFSSRRGGKAGLTVSREKLIIFCMGTHEFRPDQVVAFEPDGPAWMSRGVRIQHNRADIAGGVYFSCSGGRAAIVEALTQVGFVACGAQFVGIRRPGSMRLAFIVIAMAAAVMLSMGDPW